MIQSLMAIAAFMAVVSGVIFGVSRFEKTKKEDAIELVSHPFVTEPVVTDPPTPVGTEPESVASEPAEEPISEAPASETPVEEAATEPVIADKPVAELIRDPEPEPEPVIAEEPVTESISEPVISQAVEPASAAPELEIETVEPRDEVEEVILPPVIQDPKRQELMEPRAEIAEVMIPPTIQDPKRPNDGKVEDLTQEILTWGQSKNLKHVAQLRQYATHADPIVRSHVATSLGRIVGAHPVSGEVERSIPVLGKLTNDPDLKVRLYAVQSLGAIRSEKVLPYLEKALLSPSGSVMKAANTALQNLKLQYGKAPSMQIAEKMLEKPKKNC